MKRDDLFDLIKSLAPNEKRYFKLFVKQHGDDSSPKYLELFDALDGMKEYDLPLLEQRVEDKRILRFLNQEKGYLKGRIMDALRAYRGGKSVDSMLYAQMEDMDILYEKGLYSQCLKLLQKSKNLAETYDRFGMLVEILRLERKLTIELKPHEMLSELRRIDNDQDTALARLRNLVQFQNMWRTLLVLFRQEGYRGENGVLQSIPTHEDLSLLSQESNAWSFGARHFFRLANSVVARIRGNFEKAVEHYEDLLTMWRSRKDRIDEGPMEYALVIANYLNMQHKRGVYDAFEEHIAEMKEMKLDSFGDRAERFQNTAHLELLFFLNRQLPLGEFTKYDELEREITKGLETYREKVNAARRLAILHNLMVANFFMEDWHMAIKWWLKIDQDEDARHARREIYDFSRIMQLILQFQLGEFEWLHDLARNHRRSLERGDRMSDFFAIVLSGIHRMSRTDDIQAHKVILTNMHNELEALLQTCDDRNILGAREVKYWLGWQIAAKGQLYNQLPQS
jgi:hypothetical protein